MQFFFIQKKKKTITKRVDDSFPKGDMAQSPRSCWYAKEERKIG
jgi:hypothetical protein